MNDFLELLRTPCDKTIVAVGQLTDPAAVLDGETDPLSGGWVPWNE